MNGSEEICWVFRYLSDEFVWYKGNLYYKISDVFVYNSCIYGIFIRYVGFLVNDFGWVDVRVCCNVVKDVKIVVCLKYRVDFIMR